MNFSAAFPNFLIGFREGLEAGLIVTILLAAVKKISRDKDGLKNVSEYKKNILAIWLGVCAALSISISTVIILVFSLSSLSSYEQELFGAIFSIIAVIFVSSMIMWMSRSGTLLSSSLYQEVERSLSLSTTALIATSFFCVAREGIETGLFLWANAQSARNSFAPICGALLGIALAVIFCTLLQKQIIRFNFGKFLQYTSYILIILAAGVLSYAVGELQNIGVIPGKFWVLYDISEYIDSSAWYMVFIQGITQFTTQMTVLQMVVWLCYSAIVFALIFYPGREVIRTVITDRSSGKYSQELSRHWYDLLLTKLFTRPIQSGVVIIIVPLLIAGLIVLLLPEHHNDKENIHIIVSEKECGHSFAAIPAGKVHFTVSNHSLKVMEINLVDSHSGLAGEIETLGPQTSQPMDAVLSAGEYTIQCLIPGRKIPLSSPYFIISDSKNSITAPKTVKILTPEDLQVAAKKYTIYTKNKIGELIYSSTRLRDAILAGKRDSARRLWLDSQLVWDRIGAAYESFGDNAQEIDGLSWGYPQGIADSNFSGLHRIEYGLWRDQPLDELIPSANKLVIDEKKLFAQVDDIADDPANMPLRGHEILEEAQRFILYNFSDYGSQSEYMRILANIDGTRVVLRMLSELLEEREPGITARISHLLDIFSSDLIKAKHISSAQADDESKQKINGDCGEVLELLSALPTLLEIPLER